MFVRKIFSAIVLTVILFGSFSQANAEWLKLNPGEFQYIGAATNKPEKITTFVIKGKSVKNSDNLSVVMNVFMPQMNGQRIALEGLNGEVIVDDVELGIKGDKNCAVHFTKDDVGIQKKIAIMNISNGATVNNHYSVGTDNDATIKFCDGSHTVFTTEKLNDRKYTDIDAENSGKGLKLTVRNGVFTEISGLNSGFNITIKPGNNVGEKLILKTDGGQGTVKIADKVLKLSGKKEVTITI